MIAACTDCARRLSWRSSRQWDRDALRWRAGGRMHRGFRRRTLLLATALAISTAAPASADDFVETSGRILTFGLPAAAGAYALYRGDRQGLFQIGASVVSAYGVSYLLQRVVKEERPDHSDWHS